MAESGTVSSRIKLNELAYDAALVLFPFILERSYDRLAAFRPGGLPFMQIFLACAIYFLPLLVGKMYSVDFADSPKRVRKCVLGVLFVTVFFAYGNLLKLVLPMIDDPGSYGIFIMVTATVFLIMGPMAGLAFTRKDAPGVEGASTQMIVFLMTAGMLPLFYLFMAGEEIFGNTGIILSMLIIIGLVIGDVLLIIILYLAYSRCKKILIRAGFYDACVFAVRLLTPFCVSFLLVLFFINTDRLFMGARGEGGAWRVLLVVLLYVVSGVLPLRVMMMLAPPVKPASVLMGVASIAFMMLALAAG